MGKIIILQRIFLIRHLPEPVSPGGYNGGSGGDPFNPNESGGGDPFNPNG